MKTIKTIFRIFFLALITVLILGVIIKLDYDHALKTVNSDNSEKVTVEITTGETVDQIITSLSEKGLLNEKWNNYFKIYLKLNNLSSKLQAGTYDIPKNLNIVELVNTLQNGKDPEVWVTIPEGLRKDEIADILATNLGSSFSKENFLNLTKDTAYISTLGLSSDVKDLEGFLFPDKYAFASDTTEKEIVTKMIDNFKTKVGTSDSYKTIIVASLVEREGYDSTDRPTIAGIILKRYNEGWKLGLDVTVLYIKKTWDATTITQADLDSDSPYNTRKFVGLPPTPICNPGLESINAVRNPVTTSYYYFIRGNDNVTHYAVTYQEHLDNVSKYLN